MALCYIAILSTKKSKTIYIQAFLEKTYMMEFCVTRISQGLVAPSGATPSGLLELSAIDTLTVLRCNARTLHIFRDGRQGVHEVIQKALSDALVPYYPLAGKLHVSDQNELQVACSGDGIWFVEASADCTLDSVDYLNDAASIPYEKLLPVPPQEDDSLLDPLVQIQVTEFRCHGFVIGLTFCHSVCDGLGAAQFLKAVGELARGHHLSLAPVWCRNFLLSPRRPHQLEVPPPIPPPQQQQLEHARIDISADKMKELKREFEEWSGKTRSCSTFEMAASILWAQRTRALLQFQEMSDEKKTTQVPKLVFFANCRGVVEPAPLPKGFYGNCFFPVSVTMDAATVKMNADDGEKNKSSIFQVVKLIQEAKAGLATEFGRWVKGEMIGDEDPFGAAGPVDYMTMFVSEWGRLGFNEVDYGWGKPEHVVPVQGSTVIPVGIVMGGRAASESAMGRGGGVRLMTWCVHNHHLQPLLHCITPYTY